MVEIWVSIVRVEVSCSPEKKDTAVSVSLVGTEVKIVLVMVFSGTVKLEMMVSVTTVVTVIVAGYDTDAEFMMTEVIFCSEELRSGFDEDVTAELGKEVPEIEITTPV